MPNANPGFGLGPYGRGQYGNAPITNLPLGYYLSLITSEYQGSPKFIAWLTAVLRKLDDVSECLATFDTAFNINYAIGSQLDLIGQNLGQSRTVAFQPSRGVSPVLDDDTYRLLLRATIAQNQWDGRIDSLQTIWQSLFPGGRITIDDAQNMSVTILLSGFFSSIKQDLIVNGYIVPRAEGVLYQYTFATLPILGFDQNTSFLAGFDRGHWS